MKKYFQSSHRCASFPTTSSNSTEYCVSVELSVAPIVPTDIALDTVFTFPCQRVFPECANLYSEPTAGAVSVKSVTLDRSSQARPAAKKLSLSISSSKFKPLPYLLFVK